MILLNFAETFFDTEIPSLKFPSFHNFLKKRETKLPKTQEKKLKNWGLGFRDFF